MNQRERTLLIVIGAIAVVVVCGRIVYPAWVKPMFDFDEEAARLEGELDDLEFEITKMDAARETYREHVYRTGGTDPKEVGDQCTSILNDLLEQQCRLKDVQVSPKGSNTDRKTGLMTLSYSIRGKGPLQQAVLFLKSFYEMPYMTRFKNIKLVPQKRRRRTRRGTRNIPIDEVQLTGSIDVLVPPVFFRGIPEEDLRVNQAPRLVKYRTDDYALIWEMEPFLRPRAEGEEEVRPTLTGACCVDQVCVATNTEADCEAAAGDWFPEETCSGFECPVEFVESRWTPDENRDVKRIQGCWTARNEVTVVHAATNEREYIRVGEELDGGGLIMVHPYGALVRRREGLSGRREYLYPLGELLADAVALDEAGSEPQLRAIAHHFLAEEEARTKAASVPTNIAGPPIELANWPLDQAAAAPDASGPSEASIDPSPVTERAGPPQELAEPVPGGEGQSAGELPSPNDPGRDGPTRGAEEESSVPNREGP